MMSGLSPFVLRVYILGYIFICSMAWHVKMPGHIKGLLGSCLVIPCRFDYSHYPPTRPDRVVWYQYVSRGYPLVHDDWYPASVIDIFRWKTQAYGRQYGKTCSLKIEPVTWSHHRQKIYPWVDPENVGKSTHEFYDTTVMIEVVDRADPPDLQIYGVMKVGQTVTVQCSVYHTCPTSPPTLSLNIPHSNQDPNPVELTDGKFRTTLRTTLLIVNDHQSVECSVRYRTGHTARVSKPINAECSISPLTISPTSNEFLEGQPSKVTCTATYTCSKQIPTLTWNYGSMPTSTDTTKVSDAQWRTVSTLTFTSSASDHGRSLTCYALFSNGQRQERSITLRVKRNMLSRGWSFSTPGSLTGLKGSCIVIPCKFSYINNKPSDLQVLWFLYQSNQYPAVFNQRTSTVISKYNGITSLVGSVAENNCSLKIERLEMSHNQDRIYPWVDKNPITSYHTVGHSFYDKTTQLIVSEHAQEPQLSISGIPRVGEQSTVSCSVRHTCLPSPPTLTLHGVTGTDRMMDTEVSDGIWERTLERTWTVKEENQNVKCTVSYPTGGQKASSERPLNVQCPYEDIKMVEPPGEITEGVAKSVICSVTYKCKKNTPTIQWNYEDMQSSLKPNNSNNKYTIVSNLTFIGSLDDDGKSLTCTAKFVTGETSDSATLHIKKYEKPIDPHENDTYHVLAADVPFRFSALPRSCVVIPCSFQHELEEPMTRGIWSKKRGGIVFHNGQSLVLDHFKGRTRMLGNLNEGDCSLEIDDIKPFDNGPFCFHAERDDDEYRFNNSCVFIVMKASPEKPVMTTVPAEVDAGASLTVSCSVTHTCPSHAPQFSWSVPSSTSEVSHTLMSRGVWQTTSTITFKAAGGVRNLTCTATFRHDIQQASTVPLNVKESLSYALVIAVSLAVLIVIILAVVLGVFIQRRRRHTDDSMRPPPRPEKRRSLWDRLSRRHHEDRERPPRPEKRRSFWSRFSRREDDRIGWQNERRSRNSFWSRFSRRQDNAANYSVGYLNNANVVITDTHFSKPRFPSPKNNRKQPCSARSEDYQLYSNM